MADFEDRGVTTDSNFGATGGNRDYDLLHMSPAQRRKVIQLKKARLEKWQRAKEARAEWSPEQFKEEAQRLEREKQAILEARDAA